jgi:acyl-CoA dehydrogenase
MILKEPTKLLQVKRFPHLRVINMQSTFDHWDLPFFETAHKELAVSLDLWCSKKVVDETDDRRACLQWISLLAKSGWLKYCVPAEFGGRLDNLDSRSLVIVREILSQYSPLADFSFAMQGLGSGAISLAGTQSQKSTYLEAVSMGEKIAAFALSEEGAGSDVAAISTHAMSTDDGFVINGNKTWISNGGIADFYVVFCKTQKDQGSRGISAFIIDADTKGLDTSEHLQVMSPHPLAKLTFTNCRIKSTQLLGNLNEGFKLAMQTLDIFRASVAGAALGMARRALWEARTYASTREMFNQKLIEFQISQANLGQMLSLIDSSALLTYRSAWFRDIHLNNKNVHVDQKKEQLKKYSQLAAIAKFTATENAQKVIDMALQMHGGKGVLVGQKIESLYRDIRALRIYEGASEVQQLIIGRSLI